MGQAEIFIPYLDGQLDGDSGVRDGEKTGGRGEDSSSLGEADEVDQSNGFGVRQGRVGEVGGQRKGGV